MTLIIQKPTGSKLTLRQTWQPMDPDAADYITAVETADGQALEEKVKIAIDNFVLGCKADGIWNAIKASCILAGARTLAGALVPLVGTAPTPYFFVEGDYDRETGLVGDGSTKYLNANRTGDADSQDNYHLSVYRTSTQDNSSAQIETGYGDDSSGASSIFRAYGAPSYIGAFARCRNSNASNISLTPATIGLHGISRSQFSSFVGRAGGSSSVVTLSSQAPSSRATLVYTRSQSGSDAPVGFYSLSRLTFYSIGESLDLAALDARVTDLINAIGVAIP